MSKPSRAEILNAIAQRFDVSNDTELRWVVELVEWCQGVILLSALGEDDD
jgi:hypothetical protein